MGPRNINTGAYLFGVAHDIKVGLDEEDIFRLQIRVGQTEIVQELNRIAKLVGHVTHLKFWHIKGHWV